MREFRGISLAEIFASGAISELDLLRLRSIIYTDDALSAEEVDQLLALDEALGDPSRGWIELFISQITDFIVHRCEPSGYLTTDNADWLIARIQRNGVVTTRRRLELLITVMQQARWSPPRLVRLAIEQVRLAVAEGRGALRQEGAVAAEGIDEFEIELLRRILYAFGGDVAQPITRTEADVLFEINTAVSAGPFNPAWSDFFAKFVANVVLATSGFEVPTREMALHRDVSAARHVSSSPSALDMVEDMLTSSRLAGAYREQSAEARNLHEIEQERIAMIVGEGAGALEPGWLAERLGQSGRLEVTEAALIAYLEREKASLHPVLAEAVARMRCAA
ncbi:MAG: hypothetical protein KDJ37_18000 [Hyphomicrobiaceae bacterium]|nr:hypothetical protein [Hyphomicrobiaceae bacterium]